MLKWSFRGLAGVHAFKGVHEHTTLVTSCTLAQLPSEIAIRQPDSDSDSESARVTSPKGGFKPDCKPYLK